MVLFALNASGAHAKMAPISCVTCHKAFKGTKLAKPVTDWTGSIHYQNGITCNRCHGGNAKVKVGDVLKLTGPEFAAIQAAAMSKKLGFIGKPSGRALFDMCAKCHPSEVARFEGSIMGKAYLNNKGGPSCFTCHHAHNNVIPAVPKVCSQCHKDTTGFTQVDPMNVTVATITQLSKIRIELAREKTVGSRPALVPSFKGDLGSYTVGLLAFGAVIFLFLLGFGVYVILEKGDEK